MRNRLRAIATFGTVLMTGLASAPTASAHWIDWQACGLAKPHPTGPMNNCHGYFHTGWRAWTTECQPPPAQIPIVIMSTPKAEPAPTPAPAPAATPPTTPPTPPMPITPAVEKSGAAANKATVTRVSATQPAAPRITPNTATRPSDSGWTPVPATLPQKR